jgi:hypothetical protein
MMRLTTIVVCFAVAATAAQSPSLDQVIARGSKYAADFEARFSGLVAEEQYVQETRLVNANNSINLPTSARRDKKVTLRSDYLLVMLPGNEGWFPFRDVFEVDGQPVRDREDRLVALFLKPSEASLAQARRLMEESARHNVGPVFRTINIPILALMFLRPDRVMRFKFDRDGEETIAGRRAWRIQYRETAKPSLIRSTDGRDLDLTGRYWIEPDSGVVLKTTLRAGDWRVRGDITVSYRLDPKVETWVPAEMSELYREARMRGDTTAKASYANYRRFQVSTAESVGKPPGR